jgi:diguanylate cyclase
MSENAPPELSRAGRAPWIARNNYRYRTGSHFGVFVAMVPELWGHADPYTWIALAALCLVYPHVMFQRARRAEDVRKAELQNLVVDAFLWGAMMTALHFPMWPAGMILLGTLLNSAFCGGVRVLWRSGAAMLVGTAACGVIVGLELRPHTHWFTVTVLAAGTSIYLIAVALASHWRYHQLRIARESLRLGEQALEQQLAEISKLQHELSEQAIRDSLTGLFNRRYLETIVPQELARRAREGGELALMMLDVDHFKSINDRYGHQGGDEVLKALGSLLNATVRSSDVACRFGGEEFLLLLPNMPSQRVLERAEQWRREFAETTVESNGASIRATLSIGVAMCPRDGSSMDELIRAADLALYDAKYQGRDRVVLATPADVGSP